MAYRPTIPDDYAATLTAATGASAVIFAVAATVRPFTDAALARFDSLTNGVCHATVSHCLLVDLHHP